MANVRHETSCRRHFGHLVTDFYLEIRPTHPTTLYVVDQSTITIVHLGWDVYPQSKYIDIRYYIIREALADGILRHKYIRKTDMMAGILTKTLLRELHQKHTLSLGVRKGFGWERALFFSSDRWFYSQWKVFAHDQGFDEARQEGQTTSGTSCQCCRKLVVRLSGSVGAPVFWCYCSVSPIRTTYALGLDLHLYYWIVTHTNPQ